MSTTRQFKCEDLLRFNGVNLDVLTETYNMAFYLQAGRSPRLASPRIASSPLPLKGVID
jgi:hypothetical protein